MIPWIVLQRKASSEDQILETAKALPNRWLGLMGIFGGDLTIRMKETATSHSFNHSCRFRSNGRYVRNS